MEAVVESWVAATPADPGGTFPASGVVGPFSLWPERPWEIARLREISCPGWFSRRVASALDPAGGPIKWIKSLHASSRTIYDLASDPVIVGKVEPLLGPDVMLWGSEVVSRRAGAVHRWHVDLEHVEWEGLTVWLALGNVTRRSTLSVIPGSQHFPCTPQQLAAQEGLDLTDDAAVLAAARRFDPSSRMVPVAASTGQFVVFAGRLWHGSRNQTSSTRTALILQYAPPSSAAKIPVTFDLHPEWHPDRPACCLIRGVDRFGLNRIVPAPPARMKLARRAPVAVEGS